MYIHMLCHIIFDVNMDFTKKVCYVATDFHSPKSDEKRYAGVFSRDSFHIAFTYNDLYEIDIGTADINNFYLTSPVSENYCTIYGP